MWTLMKFGVTVVSWPWISRETNLLAKLVYVRRKWLYLWYKMTCSLRSYLQIRQYGMASTLNCLICHDLCNQWCLEESILLSTETLRLKDTRRQVLVFHIFQLANEWLWIRREMQWKLFWDFSELPNSLCFSLNKQKSQRYSCLEWMLIEHTRWSWSIRHLDDVHFFEVFYKRDITTNTR